MDINCDGIHYIEIDQHIPEHIKRCHSEELVMNMIWALAKASPSSLDEANVIIYKNLLTQLKLKDLE